MVWKVCCKSQGQPLPGVRNAAMISISRAMSWEGFTGVTREVGKWGRQMATVAKTKWRFDFGMHDSHKTYYGIFLIWLAQPRGERPQFKKISHSIELARLL